MGGRSRKDKARKDKARKDKARKDKARKGQAAGLPSVNLLSPWAFERIAVRRLRIRFLVAAVVLLSVVAGGWALQAIRVADAEALLRVEQAETARLTEQTNALQPVKAFVGGVEQQKATVSETMAREIYFSRVLESMQDAAPAGVVLDSIAVTLAPPPAPAPAPAEGGEEGSAEAAPAAPVAPALPSPCPGPDPFQTRPVVGCITVSGTAGSRSEVGSFVIALGADEAFVEPFVSTTTTADAAEVTFSGSVGLSEKVFSKRYAKLDKLLAGEG